MAMCNLAGKVALITGASSGIGAATAALFSKLGAQLAITGRKENNLQKTGDQCQIHGAKPLLLTADLSKEDNTKKVLDSTIAHFKKLDILVSVSFYKPFSIYPFASLTYFIEVSIYHLTMLAVPHLVATKGNIVNVSSVNGLRSFPGVLSYNMSKSALDQMTQCAALELAPKQVRVNSVNPGVIITELQKRGGISDEAYVAFLDRCKQTHALGRPGQVDEVAAAIAFLASDASSFITGALLPVDGGRHAMCPR
ncbi:uncharacterized protein LOC106884498 [Octopus bimaculoides]|nr:uncharacterized protein LOC106884498 [Octopus bimaculoides]|eukprot:XP_014791400.1 PREDICTED: tropinone reductase 2-like [Octopus bimaculoides]